MNSFNRHLLSSRCARHWDTETKGPGSACKRGLERFLLTRPEHGPLWAEGPESGFWAWQSRV